MLLKTQRMLARILQCARNKNNELDVRLGISSGPFCAPNNFIGWCHQIPVTFVSFLVIHKHEWDPEAVIFIFIREVACMQKLVHLVKVQCICIKQKSSCGFSQRNCFMGCLLLTSGGLTRKTVVAFMAFDLFWGVLSCKLNSLS